MPTRRAALQFAAVSLLMSPRLAAAQSVEADIASLERRMGGRLGVAVLDTATNRRWAYRGDERFPMASTFKFLAAAFVLSRADRGIEQLNRRVIYAQADLVTYSPVTEKRVAEGMTIAELCDAAITLSDNTAGNLLLASFGGPTGLTGFLRSRGDQVTRLDRTEPMLNEATPGDPRDTTTPLAMLSHLQAFVLGDALTDERRERLRVWLIGTRTGGKRLRAGLPGDWRVGDKTGGGDHGTSADIGVLWPPGRAPLVVASYATEVSQPPARDAIHAEVGLLVAKII